MEAVQALMAKFSHRAFITRKSRASTLLDFSDIEESVSKQHSLISTTGEQIHKLLQVYSLTVLLKLKRRACIIFYDMRDMIFIFLNSH